MNGQVKGGHARAESLSADQRREIARKGAAQRWQQQNRERFVLPTSVVDDGRVFCWRRATLPKVDGSVRDPSPVIRFDPLIGGRDMIVATRRLSPDEYFDNLDTLSERYPAPPIPEDA